MDFVVKRLNSLIDICSIGSMERITYQRERIEYILFLLLGFLWNRNIDNISLEDRSKIVKSLSRISIGGVIDAIRILDINNEILNSKRVRNIINSYPNLRNSTIGHGYSHNDKINDLSDSFDMLYDELHQHIDMIQKDIDIVVIETFENDTYKGYKFDTANGTMPVKWSCPGEMIQENDNVIDRTYVCLNKHFYFKISPFVYINNLGEGVYVFNSLAEKLIGNVKLNRLFRTDNIHKEFIELVTISSDSENRRISANGTIMNVFELNHKKYIDIGFKSMVNEFLINNKSSVSATIWGHGGVGKTACIQTLCCDYFNDFERVFNYIIFISAKDRMYDPRTGNIYTIGNIRYYDEIIRMLINVIFDEDFDDSNYNKRIEDYEDKIAKIENRTLIIIDDYETFSDEEKGRIYNFIYKLNVNYHKVIITTRNNRLVVGNEISSYELTIQQTKDFLHEIVRNEYIEHERKILTVLNNDNSMQKIQEATSGRPIFIYQFAHLFAQHGFSDDILNKLKNSSNAKEFLYGRIYEYLSVKAQNVFICISQLADKKDMLFRLNILEYLIISNEFQEDDLSDSMLELEKMMIIEKYNDDFYRVYSHEIYLIMCEYYKQKPASFQNVIRSKLSSIGGTDIKGSIFDAMLNEANKSRLTGNEKEVIEKYRHILNHNKCPVIIKKQSLMCLTNYLSNDRMSLDRAIKTYDEFYQQFERDANITKAYVQLLWRNDDTDNETDKDRAVEILLRFFVNKRKADPSNLDLFALAVGYCSYRSMFYCITCQTKYARNISSKELKDACEMAYRQANRILNEYGRELFDYIKGSDINRFLPSIKHNICIALIQTVNLCIELGKTDSSKLEYARTICDYAKQRFPANHMIRINTLADQISKLKRRRNVRVPWWDEFTQKYKEGDIVQATVENIVKYAAFVLIESKYKAFVHISEITDRFVDDIYLELSVGQEVTIKIKRIDVTLKRVTASIKDAI
jgi:hypothetical protein